MSILGYLLTLVINTMLVAINYGHSIDMDRVHNNNTGEQSVFSKFLFFFQMFDNLLSQRTWAFPVIHIWIGITPRISAFFRMENPESVKAQKWNRCKCVRFDEKKALTENGNKCTFNGGRWSASNKSMHRITNYTSALRVVQHIGSIDFITNNE